MNPSWPPNPETPESHPHLKPRVGGCAPGAEASCPTHRPKAAHGPDQALARVTQAQSSRKTGPALPRLKTSDRLIKGLAACQGPHLKVLVLNNSYLVPVHRVLQGLLALYD